MQPTNRPEVAQAIRRYFGVNDGEYVGMLGREIVPTVPIMDAVEETPYGSIFRQAQAGNNCAAGGATKFSALAVHPGAAADSTILQLIAFTVANETATPFTANLRLCTATAFAASGFASVSTANMNNVSAPVAGLRTPSILRVCTFTAATPGLATGLAVRVPAESSVVVTLPKPGICLWSNDSGGIPAAVVVCSVLDLAMRAGFVVREWPIL